MNIMWVKNVDDCKPFLLTEPDCYFNGNSFAITTTNNCNESFL